MGLLKVGDLRMWGSGSTVGVLQGAVCMGGGAHECRVQHAGCILTDHRCSCGRRRRPAPAAAATAAAPHLLQDPTSGGRAELAVKDVVGKALRATEEERCVCVCVCRLSTCTLRGRMDVVGGEGNGGGEGCVCVCRLSLRGRVGGRVW